MGNYNAFLARKSAQYGAQFDPSDLDARFVRFYNSGERIRVDDCGMIATGTVGVTTGWKPVFLLLRNRRSVGSSILCTSSTKLLAVKRGRAYCAVHNGG